MDDSTTTLSEENRLFRAALSARNAGSHGRCVGLLSELITKFPSSPLRQEAIVAQFRCQSSGGQFAAAHRTALRYLSEYPSGFARDEARSLVVDAAQ
jgi:outer membrane protein assembly factor BamD (BamD/ComL family)